MNARISALFETNFENEIVTFFMIPVHHRTFSERELQEKRNLTMGRQRAITRMLGMKHGEDQRAKSIHGNREE